LTPFCSNSKVPKAINSSHYEKEEQMKTALIFFFAVLSEVIATTSLKFSEGFTKLLPSIIVVVGYGLSFYLLSISLKVMPVGIAYALWSGIGIILTVIAGKMIWHEALDWARVTGIGLILLGILIINLFSKITAR
jgi:small multidrug resistance pump